MGDSLKEISSISLYPRANVLFLGYNSKSHTLLISPATSAEPVWGAPWCLESCDHKAVRGISGDAVLQCSCPSSLPRPGMPRCSCCCLLNPIPAYLYPAAYRTASSILGWYSQGTQCGSRKVMLPFLILTPRWCFNKCQPSHLVPGAN